MLNVTVSTYCIIFTISTACSEFISSLGQQLNSDSISSTNTYIRVNEDQVQKKYLEILNLPFACVRDSYILCRKNDVFLDNHPFIFDGRGHANSFLISYKLMLSYAETGYVYGMAKITKRLSVNPQVGTTFRHLKPPKIEF